MKTDNNIFLSVFFVILICFIQCKPLANKPIKIGDTVLIEYVLKNKEGNRFDDSFLPSGNLPLRIKVGRNDFPFCNDSLLLHKKNNDTINLKYHINNYTSEGLYYKPLQNTVVYYVRPNEIIDVHIIIKKVL